MGVGSEGEGEGGGGLVVRGRGRGRVGGTRSSQSNREWYITGPATRLIATSFSSAAPCNSPAPRSVLYYPRLQTVNCQPRKYICPYTYLYPLRQLTHISSTRDCECFPLHSQSPPHSFTSFLTPGLYTGSQVTRQLMALCSLVSPEITLPPYDPGCTRPLGMQSGAIQDDQITASSSNSTAPCARLHGNVSWTATKTDQKQWLAVDLRSLYTVFRVATQGNPRGDQWVTSYSLQHQQNHTEPWLTYEEGGLRKVSLLYVLMR